jgi:hypothetical protein
MTTPAEAIKLYLDLRDGKLAALTKEYTAAKNELEDAMEALEGFLLLTMQERNETQIKTAAGVAFRSPQMRVKMVDRASFLDYCVVNHDFSMITNHVSKDAVREIVEGGGTPPGVEVTEFITCNVRRA